jgi:4-amino-4-deoxy-L-arabinose transferase-like glycosyltransferase
MLKLVVAACLKCGIGLPGIVALQVVVAFLSLPCLYSLGRRVGGAATGALAVLLHAGNPDVAAWHTFILTDSLYASALVIFLWFYVEAYERGWIWRLAVVPAMIALVSIRPNGWIVAPALCMHALLTAKRWPWSARLAGVAALTALLLTAALCLSGLRQGINTESPVQMLYKGEVLGATRRGVYGCRRRRRRPMTCWRRGATSSAIPSPVRSWPWRG